MKIKQKIIVFLFAFCLSATPALAVEFDPDYLISDNELAAYNSLTLDDIKSFLDKQPGTLKQYICVDKEGNFKTAVQTFYEVAQKWLINPKYLLILVQKEMGLLDETTPKQTQYDWATGYGCKDGSACDPRWQGFYKQVNSAAAQTRYYLDNIHEFHYQPGRTYNIDGWQVTPKNTATAGLYSYTPHVDCGGDCGGNKLFWNLWNKHFAKKWPNGSLLKARDSEQVYLIKDGKKRAIASQAILISRFDPAKVVEVELADIASYDDGPAIKYLNFSLLKNSGSEIYLISDDKKRKIQNQTVFNKIGFMEDEVIAASDADLASYETGPEITEFTLYPTGALLKNNKTQETYYVLNGKKRLVTNKEILNANFLGLTASSTSPEELDRYRTGSPMTLPDGNLVKIKNVNTVYVISNNKRLPIFNADIFLSMNYKWSNVITVSPETLEVHPLGQTITGEW